MAMSQLTFITDFADQAVVLPVALAVLAALVLLAWRRAAFAWAFCIAATLGVTLFMKLVVMACGIGEEAGLGSPSGHTAGAAAVYGGAVALMVRGQLRGTVVAAGSSALVALAIGLTRLGLGVHSVADVCVGGATGIAGACAMRWLAGPRSGTLNLPRLAAVAIAAMLVFHGHRLNAEPRLRWAALEIWPLSMCH